MRDAEEVAREALGCAEVHPDCPAWLHPTGFHTPPMPCTRCDALHAAEVIRARDAEVRAATLAEFTEVSRVDYSVVRYEDGERVHRMGASSPWSLKDSMNEHPEWFPEGSRIERCVTRWRTTEGESEWSPWEPEP